MSLLNDLLKQIQGGVAQVNPWDGGQDYRSVTQPRPQPKPAGLSPQQRYESAFNRGDLNSPDIIGVDPAQFGYAEDIGQYGGRPVVTPYSNPLSRITDPRRQVMRGLTPYSPGEGPRTRF